MCLTVFCWHVSEIASQLFALATSEISPANFTEGDASQAVCTSAKVSEVSGKTRALAIEGEEPQMTTPIESRKRTGAEKKSTGKRQKSDVISFDCLEGQGGRGIIAKADLDSEEETDGEDKHKVIGTLPSSSGTTEDSDGDDGDSDGEKSVDSGEQAGGQGDEQDEVEEISEGVMLPVFKSYDPKFVSPQEVPKTKAQTKMAVTSPVEANQLGVEEKEVVEEDRLDSTPTPEPSIFRSSNMLGLEVAVEATGSDCLPGRSKVEKTSGKKTRKKTPKSPLPEKVVMEDEEEDQEEELEGGDADQAEKEPQRKNGKLKFKEKPLEDGNTGEDGAEKESQHVAKDRKKRLSKDLEDEAEAENEVENSSRGDQVNAKEPGKSRVKTRAQLQAEAVSLQGQVEKKKKRRRK